MFGQRQHAHVDFRELMQACAVRAMASPPALGPVRGGILLGTIAGFIEGMKQQTAAKSLLRAFVEAVPGAEPAVNLAAHLAPNVINNVRRVQATGSGIERVVSQVSRHPAVEPLISAPIEIEFPAMTYPFVSLGVGTSLWIWHLDPEFAHAICSVEVEADQKQGYSRSTAELKFGDQSKSRERTDSQGRSHSQGDLDRSARRIVDQIFDPGMQPDNAIRQHLAEGLSSGLRVGMSNGPRVAMLAKDSSVDPGHLENLVGTLQVVMRWCGPHVQSLIFKDGCSDPRAFTRTCDFLWHYLTDSVSESDRARFTRRVAYQAAARGILFGATLWEHEPSKARQLSLTLPLLRQLLQFEEQ